MMLLYLAAQLAGLAAVFWWGSERTRFLYALAFLLPLESFNVIWQVSWSWSKIAFPLTLLVVLVYRHRDSVADIPGIRLLMGLGAYVTILTLVMAYFTFNVSDLGQLAVSVGWGPAQSTYRYLVQLSSFICTWGLLFTGFWMVRTEAELRALVNGFVNGNLLNAVAGGYQTIGRWFGLPWLPGWFVAQPLDGDYSSLGDNVGFSVPLHRLSGFGGEPKHAASNLVLAAVLLLSTEVLSQRQRPIFLPKLKVFILIVAALLTFSTGGWLALFAVGCYMLLTVGRRMRFWGYAVCLAFILGLAAVWIGASALTSIYERRIVDRMYQIERTDLKNAAFVSYILDNPMMIVAGHGAGGVDFRLIEYARGWFDSPSTDCGTLTPSQVLLRLLGDVGIIGLLVIATVWAKWAQVFRKEHRAQYRQFLLAGAVACSLGTAPALCGYLLLCGGMIAHARRNRSRGLCRTPRWYQIRRWPAHGGPCAQQAANFHRDALVESGPVHRDRHPVRSEAAVPAR